ncbi:MAG TPA: helix-turn-helix transcriptional regulator [Pseudonocardiaceae bacterium]|nr:helix-turn-helix transcriptional regulator [Pseudonocardiaceae bacterium]
MTDETPTLGQTLKSVRELQGKSLKVVADGAQISPAYLQKLEKDGVTAPSPHVLHRLAGQLGVEYLELMRLAGYVVPGSTGSAGALAQALSSQDLTEEEARALATFLKMYRSGQNG